MEQYPGQEIIIIVKTNQPTSTVAFRGPLSTIEASPRTQVTGFLKKKPTTFVSAHRINKIRCIILLLPPKKPPKQQQTNNQKKFIILKKHKTKQTPQKNHKQTNKTKTTKNPNNLIYLRTNIFHDTFYLFQNTSITKNIALITC